MKVLFKAIAIIVLAAIGAGSVIYLDAKCPEKQKMRLAEINKATAKYIDGNTAGILEKIAKNDNFRTVVKSLSTISDSEINDKIKAYIAENPAVLEDYIRNNGDFIADVVINSNNFKDNSQQQKNSEEDASSDENASAENPDQKFLDHWEEMRNSAVAPYAGPKDAKVAVVEFFDFACGHCKALAPVIRQLIKDNPDVKFVFQPLYFISEHSYYAAKASLAAFENGKFLEVFEGIMTLPEMTEETINQILTDEGINVDEAKKLMEEKKIRRGAQEIDALSQVLGIGGVPMVFINSEPFYGRSLEDLQNKINSYK